MAQTAFTRAGARAKAGKRGRTRITFAGVPQGAIGTIIGADRMIDGYDVEVAAEGQPVDEGGLTWLTRLSPPLNRGDHHDAV
jgi:hypothetical protein